MKMTTYLLWAIAGFVLIIAELVTGTFYLLVLGVAALVAALVAYLGGAFWLQAIFGAAAAFIGIYLVHTWWQNHPKDSKAENSLDVGQTVVFEEWINEAGGIARVKYRGSNWDAKVEGAPKVNDVLTIKSAENGVLHVASVSS
jgi:membrane protein implicated in regulation of membrane protease activity